MYRSRAVPTGSDPVPLSWRTRLWAAAILLLSLAFALLWSHYKLFWVDELLEFYTDSKPTAAAIVFGQLHYPFSLEPPGFHLLLHFLGRVFPAHPEFGSRLISILSLSVTEICVFRITLRLTAQANTALLAMALPLLFVTIDYAPEARVYSLLAALFALAILSYQSAIEETGRSRALALAGLFASLSAAILVHYYSILFPLPILAGEAVRTLRRRRVDWPLLLVLAAACAMFALNLPFLKPLHEIQANYYNTGETRAAMIPFTYLWLLCHFKVYFYLTYLWSYRAQFISYRLTDACLIAFVLLVFFRILRPARDSASLPVLIAVMGGFFLPVANVLMAHYATHAYVPRYSLPAIVSISILLSLLLERPLRRPRIFAIVLTLVLGVSSLYAAYNIHHQRAVTRLERAEFVSNPELVEELAAAARSPSLCAGRAPLPELAVLPATDVQPVGRRHRLTAARALPDVPQYDQPVRPQHRSHDETPHNNLRDRGGNTGTAPLPDLQRPRGRVDRPGADMPGPARRAARHSAGGHSLPGELPGRPHERRRRGLRPGSSVMPQWMAKVLNESPNHGIHSQPENIHNTVRTRSTHSWGSLASGSRLGTSRVNSANCNIASHRVNLCA